MENKGQVRKMKENQWKTQGKASQTERQKKYQNKTKKIPKKIQAPSKLSSCPDQYRGIGRYQLQLQAKMLQ